MNWTDPDQWRQLKQGVTCPMCKDIHLPEDQHSILVAETDHTYIRLPKNQVLRGWTVVFAKRHVCELFEFSTEELNAFWQTVSQTGRALDAIYHPPKINYCVYGNLVPHVHCHLYPQNYAEAPKMLTVIESKVEELTDSEYKKMIADLQTHLDI